MDHINKNEFESYSQEEKNYDSQWANAQKFRSTLKKVDLKNKNIFCGGIPLWSDGHLAYVDDSDSHSLIFGSTGSKKTRLLAMPMLRILGKAGESMIVTDPKGELYERTAALLKDLDYNLIVLNFRNPSTGSTWNPLDIPHRLYKSNEKDKASELLNDLVKNIMFYETTANIDPFWDNSASDFCYGLLMVLFECAQHERQVNLRNISSLKNSFISMQSNFYEHLNKHSLAYISLSGTMDAFEKTQGSILSVFDQHLRLFCAQSNLSEMLSYSNFSLDSIGFKKSAVFIIMPDEKTTYHRLVSIFIKQCYESLIAAAQANETRTLPIRTNFILDEFSNLPPVTDFPAMITAARSRNIRFCIITQSDHQLKARYREESETIKSNCNNWVFLTSRELPLLRQISELCGYKDGTTPLISVSKLQRFDKERGEALVLNGRNYPYVTTLADIDAYDKNHYARIPIPFREKRKILTFNFKNIVAKLPVKSISELFKDDFLENIDDDQESAIMAESLNNLFEEQNHTNQTEQELPIGIQAALEAKFDEFFGEVDVNSSSKKPAK